MTVATMTSARGRRSLPEHTVDCWVSASVLAQYPEALLWAPTQRGPDNWDIAFEMAGQGKAFILEDKATVAHGSEHRIRIDGDQLERYVRLPGAPVYYVTPDPPWPADASAGELSPVSPVPAAALCRTGTACSGHSGHGPFPDWCYVVEAERLWSWLGGVGSRELPAAQFAGLGTTLGEFLRRVGDCTAGDEIHKSADEARIKWAARQPPQAATLPGEQHLNRGRLARSGVLAVFVPMPDVPTQ